MPSPRLRLIPTILRVGLGFVWVYQGLIEIVTRSHALRFDAPAWAIGLGVIEMILGLALLAGLGVRQVAAVQLALLIVFTVGVVAASPQLLTDPLVGVSRNVGLIAATLCLYWLS